MLGVVGWIDLTGDVERQLDELDGPLVGVRHQVHDEADPEWLLREEVQRGLAAVGAAGLVYDLLVRPRELPPRSRPQGDIPRSASCSTMPGRRRALGPRRLGARRLGARRATECDVQALGPLHRGRPGGNGRQRALDWFGPERCMFGSDWPVCLLASEYGDAIAIVGDDPEVLAGTAIRTYGLALP